MFDIFIADLVKNTAENQPNIYIDRLNKMMNNGSMLSRRESFQPGHLITTLPNGVGEQTLNHRNSSIFSTSLNRPINKILHLPNILDNSGGNDDIILFFVKELEVCSFRIVVSICNCDSLKRKDE